MMKRKQRCVQVILLAFMLLMTVIATPTRIFALEPTEVAIRAEFDRATAHDTVVLNIYFDVGPDAVTFPGILQLPLFITYDAGLLYRRANSVVVGAGFEPIIPLLQPATSAPAGTVSQRFAFATPGVPPGPPEAVPNGGLIAQVTFHVRPDLGPAALGPTTVEVTAIGVAAGDLHPAVLRSAVGIFPTANRTDTAEVTLIDPPGDPTALNARIAEAQAYLTATTESTDGAGVYYPDFWAPAAVRGALQTAITDATTVAEAASTAGQLAAALTALDSAIADFLADRTQSLYGSITRLETRITYAEGLIAALVASDVEISVDGTDVFTTVQWIPQAAVDALQVAIDAAELVIAPVLETALVAYIDALNVAITTFEAVTPQYGTLVDPVAARAALVARLAEIAGEGLVEENFTPATWQALQDAIASAEALLLLPDVYEDLRDELIALNAARDGLVHSPLFLARQALLDVLVVARARVQATYLPAGWSVFATALAEAEAALPTTDVAGINAARTALQTAMDALVVNPVEARNQLAAAIAAAGQRVEATYTEATWAPFAAALAAAQAVYANLNATANQLVAARTALETAMADLAVRPPTEPGIVIGARAVGGPGFWTRVVTLVDLEPLANNVLIVQYRVQGVGNFVSTYNVTGNEVRIFYPNNPAITHLDVWLATGIPGVMVAPNDTGPAYFRHFTTTVAN